MKEAEQLGTYSKNKCKHFSDNLLISNTFSLLIQDSSPFIWLSPTTAPVLLLGRGSVLSFTLRATHLPQGKEFPGRDRCLFSENKPLSPNTMTHPRLYSSLHYWIFFFFFWQRSHNSGIYAKIIKQRLPLKVPIHHASPPILPFLRLTTCQPACTHVCSKVFAMLLQLLCRLPGRGDSLLTTKNASSGLEVAENILTYWQRHHRVRIVMLRT